MPKKRILMGIVIYILIISIILVIITNKSSSQVINKGGTSSDSEVFDLFAIMLETEAEYTKRQNHPNGQEMIMYLTKNYQHV